MKNDQVRATYRPGLRWCSVCEHVRVRTGDCGCRARGGWRDKYCVPRFQRRNNNARRPRFKMLASAQTK